MMQSVVGGQQQAEYPRCQYCVQFSSVSSLDDGAECSLSRFDEDTELGGVADTAEGCAAIQRVLNRL